MWIDLKEADVENLMAAVNLIAWDDPNTSIGMKMKHVLIDHIEQIMNKHEHKH